MMFSLNYDVSIGLGAESIDCRYLQICRCQQEDDAAESECIDDRRQLVFLLVSTHVFLQNCFHGFCFPE